MRLHCQPRNEYADFADTLITISSDDAPFVQALAPKLGSKAPVAALQHPRSIGLRPLVVQRRSPSAPNHACERVGRYAARPSSNWSSRSTHSKNGSRQPVKAEFFIEQIGIARRGQSAAPSPARVGIAAALRVMKAQQYLRPNVSNQTGRRLIPHQSTPSMFRCSLRWPRKFSRPRINWKP